MKKNHLLIMVFCCLIPIILVFGSLAFLKGKDGFLIWLFILLCPLSHFLMMSGHKDNHSHGGEDKEKKMEKSDIIKTNEKGGEKNA